MHLHAGSEHGARAGVGLPCPGPFAAKLSSAMHEQQRSSRSFGRTALAALIVVVAAWVLLKVVIGIVAALFVPIVAILAVVAVIWAYRVLF